MHQARHIFVFVSVIATLACGDDSTTDSDGGFDSGADASVDTSDAAVDDCGDGVMDEGEECDDMNAIDGDGCDSDCTFSCEENADCDDGLFCTGVETCDETRHICEATPLDCSDDDDCTEDLCDETLGACINPLLDEDGDGHAPTSAGVCGDDCDDTRDDVYTGAEELCDGIDNNCNVDIDEVAPTWYVDCDGDGFAADTGSSRVGCDAPPSSATGCDGEWVSRRPVDATNTDCNDSNDNMFPGQTTYFTSPHTSTGVGDDARYGNYDCNGVANRDHPTSGPISIDAACEARHVIRTFCQGLPGWASSAPSCGGFGNYSECGEPELCVPSPSDDCSDATAVCVGASARPGDPCYCPFRCVPSCTPGTRGCIWRYYRCERVNLGRTQMACH